MFCADNPVNSVDPYGWIDWQDDTVKGIRDGYMKTAHGAQKIAQIEALEKSTGTTISVAKGNDNQYDRNNKVTLTGKGTVYRSGDDKNVQGSPMEALNHELDHAQNMLSKGYTEYMDMVLEKHPKLENMLEKSAVDDTNLLRKEIGNKKPRTHYWKERKPYRDRHGKILKGIYAPVDDFGGGSAYNYECQ